MATQQGRWEDDYQNKTTSDPKETKNTDILKIITLKKTQQTNKQRTSTRDRGPCYKDLNCVEEMLKRIFGQAKHSHAQNPSIFEFFFGTVLLY